MKYEEIAIATITLARNKKEAAELTASLQQLASLGIPVTVADGGSIVPFLEFLHSVPTFKIATVNSSGVWAQAKATVQAAHQNSTPFIFYTEPDKKDFFQNGLRHFLESAQTSDGAGIIMASRSGKGFSSFPPFQQMTESTINNCCSEVIGKNKDYCYGPFLVKSKLVSYLDLVVEDIGWGWRPFLFAMAHRLGYTVDAFTDDYNCPVQQQGDDSKERIYRMEQLEQNIRGLVLSTMVAI